MIKSEEKPIMKLHHIGIVVKSITSAEKLYTGKFGGQVIKTTFEYVESQKVNICLLENANHIYVEFIEPLNNHSPVYEYAKKGGGLHHLCYEVEHLEQAIDSLRSDAKVIVKPIIGFENRRIAFLWLKSDKMGLSLIELAEKRIRNHYE